MNPTFYSLEDNSPESIVAYLVDLVDTVLSHLESNFCVVLSERDELGLGEAMNTVTSSAPKDSWASKSSIKKDGLNNAKVKPTALGKLGKRHLYSF